MRVGIGFDVHRFEDGRALVLGGVTIPGATGLAGHSDADVVCHALADAVFGAAGLGDIGDHFPPGAPEWKDAVSLSLLQKAGQMARESGHAVASVDAVVLLEATKLAPLRDEMRANIAQALDVDVSAVGIKATTTDGLGTVGRGEGAACMAVAVLEPAS